MEEAKPKNFFSIILPITVRLISAFITIILLFVSIGLSGWSDGGEAKYLERLERTTNITLIISLFIVLGIGIYQ